MSNKLLTPEEVSDRILSSINKSAESAGVPPEELLRAIAASWYSSPMFLGPIQRPPEE